MEIAILAGVLVLNLFLFYFVIRFAITHAMRDARYEEFIEKNHPQKAKWAPYVQKSTGS